MAKSISPSVSLTLAGFVLILALLSGWLGLNNRQLNLDLAAAEQQLNQLTADKADLQSQLADQEARTQTLREYLTNFNEQQSTMVTLVEELRAELQQVSEEHQRLTETQKTTQQRLESARERLGELSGLQAD